MGVNDENSLQRHSRSRLFCNDSFQPRLYSPLSDNPRVNTQGTHTTHRHMTASSSSNCNPQTGCAQQTGKRVSKGEEGVSLFAAACKYGTMRLYSAQNFISGFHTTFYACVTYFEQNGNQAIFPSSCNLMTLLDYDGFPSCWVCVYHHRQNWTQRLQ